MRHVSFILWTLVPYTLASPAAEAQSSANRGDIVGSVSDGTGAVIPDAAVTVTNVDTGFSRTAASDASGQFRFLRLEPGDYILAASAPSFATTTVDGVRLRVGASVAVDVALPLPGSTTSFEVTASLIDTRAASTATGISETAIANLPINGRRFQEFATLTPTVQIEPQRSTLSFAGQRGVNGNVMLDGSDYNNPFFGGIRGGERANLVPTVPQTAVQEFQVITTGYSPEYGRSSGGLLNVITRSGTNATRGRVFWQFRNGAVSATEPIFGLKSGETQHQFGGSVGGPISEGRAFYFVAVERQQARAPREVVFDRLVGIAPTGARSEAFHFYRAQEGPFELTNDATALTGRVDFHTDGGSRFNVRYNFSDAEGKNAVNTGNALFPTTSRAVSNDGIEKDRTHTVTAGHTRVVSSDVVNDLKFTYSWEERPRLANSETPYIDSVVGDVGNRNFLPTIEDDARTQIANAFAWTAGSHALKLGVDYSFVDVEQEFGFNQFGEFDLSIPGSSLQATLDTLEVMSLGGATPNRFDHPGVSYFRQIGNLQAGMDMHQAAFFLQDSWRVDPDWTVNYGIRWEGQFNPEPQATNAELLSLVQGVRSPFGNILDPARIPNATGQWMPRLGIAWSPSSLGRRLAVRAHSGIFHAASPLLLFAAASNNFRSTPGNLTVALRSTPTMTIYDQFLSVGVDLNHFSLDNLPVLTPAEVTRAFANARGVEPDPFAGANVGFVADNFENPRSFQLGLSLETEITREMTAAVELNYVNTVHLQRNRDHNMPPPIVREGDLSLRPFFGLRSRPRPVPELGAFTVRESSARSMYRGVVFKLEHRGRGLTAGAFYTLAQSFSDDDNERSAGGLDAQDQFDLAADYGPSRTDIRHLLNSYAVYSLPFGLQLSGTFVMRGGRPVNPTVFGDPNQDFAAFSDRPYRAPGVPFGRMSFRDRPVVTSNDLRVLKSFDLGDDTRVELSAELFNVLNLDNVVTASAYGDDSFGNPGIDPATGAVLAPEPGFMRLRTQDGAYDASNRQDGRPFQAQFGVRVVF